MCLANMDGLGVSKIRKRKLLVKRLRTYSRVNVNLWTDKGSEFISKHFKEFLTREGINLYHTENEEKCSVVERWNKTIKKRMWKMFILNNNTVYWDKIDKLVNNYNSSKQYSVKMTPVEASKKNNGSKGWSNLYGDLIYTKPGKPAFAVGDKVRISKYKRQVSIRVTHQKNWTEEIFVIDKVIPTKPITYSIVVLLGEAIKGFFYEQELQKAKQQTFGLEKVIRRDNKKKMALVKWSGYPDKFNSWVSFKDLVDF